MQIVARAANSSFAIWNFLEYFFRKFLTDPWFVESMDAESMDREGRPKYADGFQN